MQQQIAKLKALGRFSRVLLWSFLLLWLLCFNGLPLALGVDIVLLPESVLMFQIFYWPEPVVYEVGTSVREVSVTEHASRLVNATLSALSMLIAFLALAVVWCMDRLFLHYSQGEVFHLTSVGYLHKIGVLLIALFGASSVFETLINKEFVQMELQYGQPVTGEQGDLLMQFFTVSLDSSLLFCGLFLVLISRVMTLAVELKNEVDSTI